MLGVWSACASVGNIIGALMASAVVDYGYEVKCMFITSTTDYLEAHYYIQNIEYIFLIYRFD